DFVPGDGLPGAVPVAILRNDVWKRRFGQDPDIVGRTVRLNGRPTTVIGVMPEGFSFPTNQEVWIPLVPTSDALTRKTGYGRYVVGRLSSTATIDRVRAELAGIQQQLTNDYPAGTTPPLPTVETFQEWFLGANAVRLYRFMWIGAFV